MVRLARALIDHWQMRAPAPIVVLLAAGASLMFAWEMAQAQLYADMAGLPWLEATSRCLLATGGDLVILLAAALITAALARRLDWICLARFWPTVALTGIAFAISVGFEWHALATSRWIYAPTMPLVPILGIGLAPTIQWLVVPALCALVARRSCPSSRRLMG